MTSLGRPSQSSSFALALHSNDKLSADLPTKAIVSVHVSNVSNTQHKRNSSRNIVSLQYASSQTTCRPQPSVARPPSRARYVSSDRPPWMLTSGMVDNNVSLLQRLQHKTDLRNTDENRLTSLSWAAMEGNIEVFEWLLLDYGHDDQELSRVCACHVYIVDSLLIRSRIPTIILSCICWLLSLRGPSLLIPKSSTRPLHSLHARTLAHSLNNRLYLYV